MNRAAAALPISRDAMGVGLRPKHCAELAERPGSVDFLEALCENYLGRATLPRDQLRRLSGVYPIVGHGVGLNLMGSDPLDTEYLRRVKDLIAEFNMPFYSCHLCWTGMDGLHHHDLLPAPYRKDLLNYVADRVATVADRLGVPVGIENVSSYIDWQRDELAEWEFLREVIERAGAHYMFDVNNAYVSCTNRGTSVADYLDSVAWDRVLSVHIAGHQVLDNGLRHDTHDQHVTQEVWQWYARAWRMGGPFPTVLEWDANIPPLDVMLDELRLAKHARTALVDAASGTYV